MEFKRIDIEEYFEYSGIQFQKISEKTAKRCDTGVVKEIYADLPVTPSEKATVIVAKSAQ